MSAETRSSPFGMDPSAFGPFGAVFNAYSACVRNLGAQELNSFGATPVRPEAAMEQATAATKSLARAQLEVMGLAVRRAQAYMQVPTQLARCRTPRDLADEQMAFWRTAMEHYIGSSHRVGGSLDGYGARHVRPGRQWPCSLQRAARARLHRPGGTARARGQRPRPVGRPIEWGPSSRLSTPGAWEFS